MSKILDFICSIDAFGTSPTFFIKGDLQLTTIFGGFLSLCIYIATLVSCIYFSLEIFRKETPSVGKSEIMIDQPEIMKYPEDFLFMFILRDYNDATINSSVYYPEGGLMIRENMEAEKLNFIHCDKVVSPDHKFYQAIKKQHYEDQLKDFWCIDPNSPGYEDRLFMQSTQDNHDDLYQYFFVNLIKCSEKLGDEGCLDTEERDAIINDGYLNVFYLSNSIDATNHEDPFVRRIERKIFYTNSKKFMSIEFYMKTLTMSDDDGLLFPTENIKNAYALDNLDWHERFYYDDDAECNLGVITFEWTNNQEKYQRTYYKLQDLASEVGGIYGSLTMIGVLVLYFYNDFNYFEYLLNLFFDIRENFISPNSKGDPIKRQTIIIDGSDQLATIAKKSENLGSIKLKGSEKDLEPAIAKFSETDFSPKNAKGYDPDLSPVNANGSEQDLPKFNLSNDEKQQDEKLIMNKPKERHIRNLSNNFYEKIKTQTESEGTLIKVGNKMIVNSSLNKNKKKVRNKKKVKKKESTDLNNFILSDERENKMGLSEEKVEVKNEIKPKIEEKKEDKKETNPIAEGRHTSFLQKTSETNTESVKTKIEMGLFDKLCLLSFCESRYRSKNNGRFKYKAYFQGKQFIENLLEISSFMKHFYYQKMYLNYGMDGEQRKLFAKVSRPILSEKYIGPLYDLKNLPTNYKKRLTMVRSSIIDNIAIKDTKTNDNELQDNEIKDKDNKINITDDFEEELSESIIKYEEEGANEDKKEKEEEESAHDQNIFNKFK